MSLTFSSYPASEIIGDAVEILNETRRKQVADESRCRWLYIDNPAGEATIWVSKYLSDVVGFAALIPRRMWVHGKQVVAWNTSDLSVRPDYRRQGIASELREKARAAVDAHEMQLLYGNPNQKSQGAHKKAGFHHVGDMLRYARLVRSEGVIKRALPFPRLSKALARVADPLVAKILPPLRMLRKVRWVDPSCLSEPDSERLNALDIEHAGDRPLVGMRDAAYLQWRYGDNPIENFHMAVAESKGGLDAFALVRFVEGQSIELVDLFPTGDHEAAESLVAAVFELARERRCESVTLAWLEGHPLLSLLSKLGFALRPQTSPMFSYCAPQTDFANVSRHAKYWLATAGDRDV